MSRGKHLKIIIGVDGACSVDAINFTGSACRAATMEVASALGVQIGQRDKPASASDAAKEKGNRPDEHHQITNHA